MDLKNLEALITPTVEGMGYDLWGLEYVGGSRPPILRIYIDQPRGISLEDCEDVSFQLSGLFAVEDPILGEYNLEVSSPGLDRLLFKPEQYLRYIGRRVKLRTLVEIDGRRNFKGALRKATGNGVNVHVGDRDYDIPYEQIDRARLEPEM